MNTNLPLQKKEFEKIHDEVKDFVFNFKNMSIYTKYQQLINPDKKNNFQVKESKKDFIYKKRDLNVYKPIQTDSLFWCFYILKYGYSKYEMEIYNQYFKIEKEEKFAYIELIRSNKNMLKINKIKPISELEDDLANKDRISIKTFFALCLLEKINVCVIENRKIYENIIHEGQIHLIIRNKQTYEHHIDLDCNEEKIKSYRENYYKINNFENTLKAISYYKVDELLEICKKLEISISTNDKKKKTKKEIYELIILNFN
jgi:hypothetical protein